MANYSDYSPTIQTLIERMPMKPYCSDDLAHGLKVRPKAQALKHKYIQHNNVNSIQALVIDIDHDQAFCAADDNNVQMPSILVRNPENGHGHAVYLLKTQVNTSADARMKPQRWLAGLERAYTRRLHGDRGYSGLISRNPLLHPILDTSRIYDMSELDACLDFTDKAPFYNNAQEHGLGRNVTMFDTVRHKAYRCVNDYRSHSLFSDFILSACEKTGFSFEAPLSISEIRATAKSVANWTWKHKTSFGSGKRKGVMAMVLDEKMDLQQRQIAGASYTNKLKAERTKSKIQQSYMLALKLGGKKPTQRVIAEHTGLSIRTIKVYWHKIER